MKPISLISMSVVSLLAVLAMPIPLAAQGTHYTVTDLGTLKGGTFSQPFYINKSGLIAGSSTLPDNTQHATLWLKG